VIVAGTGHRPDKLGGYDYYNSKREWVRQEIRAALNYLKPEHGISGMALGFDQDLASVFIEMAIPFTAAIPFLGQEDAWPEHSRKFFDWLLERADDVVIVSPGAYAAWKMQVRNEWMVDRCDWLLACWDGTSGGTKNCVDYAKKVQRQMWPIDPRRFGG
jgi:uncharacterized phage-like protein YoqJ